MTRTVRESDFPPAYTGGAPVVKVLHEQDGSTVTITSTGAVIKQGQSGNPYREGWLNPAQVCNINSAQDINGHLSSGSNSPFSGQNSSSCSASAQTVPAQPSNSRPTQSQSQSQSQTVNVLGATTTAVAASTHAQTQQQSQAAPAGGKGTLPNTGPGDIFALGGLTTVIGAIGHFLYKSNRYRLG